MKKLLALILTGALVLSPALAAGTEEKFPVINVYPGYSDVKESDWYYESAKLCYEMGLIKGSDVGFEPVGTLSVVQVAVIAARMNEALTGAAIPAPQPGQSWYAPYVDYLKGLGVVLPDDLLRGATRLEFISILSGLLPDDVLPPINEITALPDTDHPAVLRFYNAGILTGIDAYGTFSPQGTLLRREGAAIVSRVARAALRLSFTPSDYTPFRAAGMTPGTVLFQNGLTAKEYLPKVMERIAALERRDEGLGVEFNWFHTLEDGTTYLDSVKNSILLDRGIITLSEKGVPIYQVEPTAAYSNFDVQVFYSRYIDLTGETL